MLFWFRIIPNYCRKSQTLKNAEIYWQIKRLGQILTLKTNWKKSTWSLFLKWLLLDTTLRTTNTFYPWLVLSTKARILTLPDKFANSIRRMWYLAMLKKYWEVSKVNFKRTIYTMRQLCLIEKEVWSSIQERHICTFVINFGQNKAMGSRLCK